MRTPSKHLALYDHFHLPCIPFAHKNGETCSPCIHSSPLQVLCSIIAGVLFYLYLASFTWMLLEGLQHFLTVRNLKVANYISAGKFKEICLLHCQQLPKDTKQVSFRLWIPAVIVAVSASVGHSSYGTHTQ